MIQMSYTSYDGGTTTLQQHNRHGNRLQTMRNNIQKVLTYRPRNTGKQQSDGPNNYPNKSEEQRRASTKEEQEFH